METYIFLPNTLKMHRANCWSLQRLKTLRVIEMTEREAQLHVIGRLAIPCFHCNPQRRWTPMNTVTGWGREARHL